MATKTTLIKKVLGPALEKEGFRYKGYKRDGERNWLFERKDGEWIQYIYIIVHDRNESVWIEIDELKPDEDPWKVGGYGLDHFTERIGFDDGRRPYKDAETFIIALEKQKERIQKYFLPGFEKLRRPRYMYCVTEEMNRNVYQNRKELLECLAEKYDIKGLREDSLVKFITDVVNEYAGSSMEEFEETYLRLSAYLGESIIHNLKGCQWEWNEHYKKCRIGTKSEGRGRDPLGFIFSAWQEGAAEIEGCYDRLFVEMRKEWKTDELWDLERQKGRKFSEGAYVDDRVVAFMEKYDFRCDFWKGIAKGWKFCREEEGKTQELWFIRESIGELWVKGVTAQGRTLKIRDIREGLAPYDGFCYCHNNDADNFPKVMEKLMGQIEKEFIPMLENEEEYLLEYDLTPEMERSQFCDREELLQKLEERYPWNGVKKEEFPGFVKKVLKENEGKSMEEFGTTLLGLGVLLGETAVKEKEGRHWLWDRSHASCIVTCGDEVFGIDPAFALNYAWQKKKPENVDRLCEDLFGDWEWMKGSGE